MKLNRIRRRSIEGRKKGRRRIELNRIGKG